MICDNQPQECLSCQIHNEITSIQSRTDLLFNLPIPDLHELQRHLSEDEQKLEQIDSNLDDLFTRISKLTSEIESSKHLSETEDYNIQITAVIQSPASLQSPGYQQPNSLVQPTTNTVATNTFNPALSMRLFQLGRQLGDGKFGVVSLCLNIETGTLYALKRIFKSVILEYDMFDQLEQEIALLQSINHPNIIKLYATFRDQYHVFLLTEYAHGCSLQKYFKSPESFVSSVIRQVITALLHIHKQFIVHRDLKPENIIYCDGIIKICDFGWATSFRQKKTNILCGTTDYVSPEVLLNGECNDSIDIWCVGILTYQLLTGKVPYKNKNKELHFENIKNCDNIPLQFPSQISANAQDFASKFLKKDPQTRIGLSEALCHPFITSYQFQPIVEEQAFSI